MSRQLAISAAFCVFVTSAFALAYGPRAGLDAETGAASTLATPALEASAPDLPALPVTFD